MVINAILLGCFSKIKYIDVYRFLFPSYYIYQIRSKSGHIINYEFSKNTFTLWCKYPLCLIVFMWKSLFSFLRGSLHCPHIHLYIIENKLVTLGYRYFFLTNVANRVTVRVHIYNQRVNYYNRIQPILCRIKF